MAGTSGPFGNTFDTFQGHFDPGDALGQQREREASEKLEKRFQEMQKAYDRYRPEAAQSRMNAFNQQLGLFNPIQQLLSSMYGGQGYDLAALGQNPMTQGMMDAGVPIGPPTGAHGGLLLGRGGHEADRQASAPPPAEDGQLPPYGRGAAAAGQRRVASTRL